jgi:PIN domain nuclease of toxin-antitoxin system
VSSSFLLDTHALVWAIDKDRRLSIAARDILSVSPPSVMVSVVSVWEIVLKHQTGKFERDAPLRDFLATIFAEENWRILLITPAHLNELCDIPMHHKDPFDRLLVAQAKAEDLTLVTRDAALGAYGVSTIW